MIGDTLRKIRAIYGLTAIDLSTELGISRSYLSEIENGNRKPTLDILEKYSEVTGIKLSSLMLMDEYFDSATDQKKERELTARLLTKLIDRMSAE